MIKSLFCAAALVATALSASAGVVYDSSSMYAVGTVSPTATSGFNGNIVTHTTYAYWAQQVGEYGGKIGLAGTERLAQSASIQMRTGTPNGNFAVAGPVTLTLNFYGIAGDGTLGGLLGSRTQTFASPAATDNTGTPFVNEGRPFYDVTFDLSSLMLSLPDEIYFGVALTDPGSTATTQSTNISVWNYGTRPGWSPTDSDFDGDTVKVGTDLSKNVWSRTLGGTVRYESSGFTPNLVLNAVPEPGTLALVGLALAATAAARRRRTA